MIAYVGRSGDISLPTDRKPLYIPTLVTTSRHLYMYLGLGGLHVLGKLKQILIYLHVLFFSIPYKIAKQFNPFSPSDDYKHLLENKYFHIL